MNKNNMSKRPKRPRDVNQLAAQIVAEAVGDVEFENNNTDKESRASEIARLGGLKGGKARAAKLTPEQRKKIAENAARMRWDNINSKNEDN